MAAERYTSSGFSRPDATLRRERNSFSPFPFRQGSRKAAKESIFNAVLALNNKNFEKTRPAVRR